MSNKTKFTITVDTEEEWDWHSGYPTDSTAVSNIRAIPSFQDACERHDARVTYFVNHTVLANNEAASIIRDTAQRPGVEIGLHIHPWNSPPLADREYVDERESFLHNLPKEIALRKLDEVVKTFESNGLTPTSYRGGRYSSSDWIQAYLHSIGCVADASFVPFTTWVDDGAPDYRQRGLEPVRRTVAGGGHIWEIPLTLAFTKRPWQFWRRFYELGERSPFRQMKMVGITERIFVKRIWLNLEHALGEESALLLASLRKHKLPCINFTMHSSSLVPGLNPYIRTTDDLERLYARLDSVLTLLGEWQEFEPATVTEVAHYLEDKHHACFRD